MGAMLQALFDVEKQLTSLLADVDGWTTLFVDYEHPFVERVWRQHGEHRIMLHRIMPCEHALYHPHPWPSAVRILSGIYAMEVGYGIDNAKPPVAAMIHLARGSVYEMTHPHGWHSVSPIGAPSLSIMITGKPWKRWSPRPPDDHKMGPLKDETKKAILFDVWKAYETVAHPV